MVRSRGSLLLSARLLGLNCLGSCLFLARNGEEQQKFNNTLSRPYYGMHGRYGVASLPDFETRSLDNGRMAVKGCIRLDGSGLAGVVPGQTPQRFAFVKRRVAGVAYFVIACLKWQSKMKALPPRNSRSTPVEMPFSHVSQFLAYRRTYHHHFSISYQSLTRPFLFYLCFFTRSITCCSTIIHRTGTCFLAFSFPLTCTLYPE